MNVHRFRIIAVVSHFVIRRRRQIGYRRRKKEVEGKPSTGAWPKRDKNEKSKTNRETAVEIRTKYLFRFAISECLSYYNISGPAITSRTRQGTRQRVDNLGRGVDGRPAPAFSPASHIRLIEFAPIASSSQCSRNGRSRHTLSVAFPS